MFVSGYVPKIELLSIKFKILPFRFKLILHAEEEKD